MRNTDHRMRNAQQPANDGGELELGERHAKSELPREKPGQLHRRLTAGPGRCSAGRMSPQRACRKGRSKPDEKGNAQGADPGEQ